MAFFQSTPNLPCNEKARIEFHLQQISECIGFERLKLPVLSEDELSRGGGRTENRSADQVLAAVGSHLDHNVSEIGLQTMPMPTQKSGGGG
jgi:hypothetical protein